MDNNEFYCYSFDNSKFYGISKSLDAIISEAKSDENNKGKRLFIGKVKIIVIESADFGVIK
jgi:hypothetical protein